MKNPPMRDDEKNWNKISTLLNKTINYTVHNLVKIAVFLRFLSDEKTIINICFSSLNLSNYFKFFKI